MSTVGLADAGVDVARERAVEALSSTA